MYSMARAKNNVLFGNFIELYIIFWVVLCNPTLFRVLSDFYPV